MKATTLAISIPFSGCNKDCPYCVSKMTWAPQINEDLFWNNLGKALAFANRSQVTDVIITSKGETLLYPRLKELMQVVDDSEFPTALQTNGEILVQKHILSWQDFFQDCGLNVLAISIDSMAQLNELSSILSIFSSPVDFILRATVNLTPEIMEADIGEIVAKLAMAGFRQVSFRQLTVPQYRSNRLESHKAAEWIQQKIDPVVFESWNKSYEVFLSGAQHIRDLPYGSRLYDWNGVSLTYFPLCVQDVSGTDDIRSLIFNQDGHLYSTWSSPASILF